MPGLDDPPDQGQTEVGRIERVILLLANSVWAVVGLFLWIPQVARVVLTSVFRLIHTALTHQSVDTVREPIRRVSRFYANGFLRHRDAGGWSDGVYVTSRSLRPWRFIGEALWIVLFWLFVLRLVWRSAFDRVWTVLSDGAAWSWQTGAELARSAASRLPEDLQAVFELPMGSRVFLGVLLACFFVAGLFLGFRRR